MSTPAQFAEGFARNLRIIGMQTAGLTHDDSLFQPPVRGNCLNWVLGHIAGSRNRILRALDAEPVLPDAEAARYARDSAPITGPSDDILRLETILAALERSQTSIDERLATLTPDDLAREIPFAGRAMPLGQVLFSLYFHETYHTGQTELLRQLAGTNDKVI